MKKTLLSILSVGFSICAGAQIANGSVAPDFTATDINGNTHTLSEYLAQGKTVIIDVSATWCGPCWAYHGSNALEDLYNSYGAGGSDEVVVLFVEGDPSTTLADLNGAGNNTQGNWTLHSPYPIIDSAAIANLYQINYFPTVFRICPDNGLVYEIDPLPAAQLKNNINVNCGIMEGLSDYPVANVSEFRTCGTSGALSVKMRNMGANTITSGTAVLKENGSVIATKEYAGNLAQFSEATLSFPSMALNEESVYATEITTVNGGSPMDSEAANKIIPVGVAQNATNQISVHVFTDNYPTEISWRIKNNIGAIVAAGGPYTASQANSTVIEDVTLPNSNVCYRFEMLDNVGDGWNIGTTPHGVEIHSNGSVVFQKFDVDFSDSILFQAAFKTSTLGLDDENLEAFSIYPNPSTGIFNIRTDKPVSIIVSDMTGKTVHSAKSIENGASLNLSGLQSGMYFARVNDGVSESVEKLIIR